MLTTLKAVIKEDGSVQLLEHVKLDHEVKALVTILDSDISYDKDDVHEIMTLSESVLSKDWLKPEEDEAWKNL
ncbi:MAG: hypothetical protein SGI89_12895 [bacterium]|nr:hypothetical protein [bacterium]